MQLAVRESPFVVLRSAVEELLDPTCELGHWRAKSSASLDDPGRLLLVQDGYPAPYGYGLN